MSVTLLRAICIPPPERVNRTARRGTNATGENAAASEVHIAAAASQVHVGFIIDASPAPAKSLPKRDFGTFDLFFSIEEVPFPREAFFEYIL